METFFENVSKVGTFMFVLFLCLLPLVGAVMVHTYVEGYFFYRKKYSLDAANGVGLLAAVAQIGLYVLFFAGLK